MKTCLLVAFCLGLILAQDPPLPPEPGTSPPGTPQPPSPSKHPHKVCLDIYNTCMQSASPQEQWKCFNAQFTCQSNYRRICRTLYQGMCCEHHNDKSVCRDKFLTCLGVSPTN
ncbi:hypothetical protein P5673_019632 [Acropora cervicornis]|uniref:Uncharacterized protein n=1 Tax=Acropora cervicornis TaxID=6130 RepID=A0AAD9V1S8_ACRCE|nr:uncharacterized protein LOC114975310 [Acropora millepora]KAK2558063.1 hypothetical protein P5673_019632 [Acropora cervicornis]